MLKLLNPTQATKLRWYILLVFSILCLHQCLIWNTFGPVAFAVQFAYGWSDATVAMMPNWGCITFLVCLIPCSWFVQAKGISSLNISEST